MLAINLSRRSWGVLSSFEWYSHCAHSWHALLVLSHIEYMNTKSQVETRADPNIRLGGNLICFPVSADHQLLAPVIHSSNHVLRPLFPPVISDVQVYTAASTNLPFQRKTIAALFLVFFFVF